jgi:hypothetical protein
MNRVTQRISKILIASTFIACAATAYAQYRPGNHKPGAMLQEGISSADAKALEALSVSWGAATSDPQEGGEATAARTYRPGRPTYGNISFTGRADAAKDKPSVSEIPITKVKDVSSSKLSAAPSGGSSEPGKLEYPNLAAAGMGEPPPSGTATVTVARGTCTSGQHFPTVKLSMRGQTVQLNDVDVSGCTDSGDTSTCTLTYRSIGG